ncbi:PfkB domain protein [Paludibacter propionicigenes WB4]|uniref:PfkB domain protein n=1 Tax=Paludibacter propionicigenes (strain DSM 17365 / JCM 13257 / WB4) TaxID=694427 RepID=E4T0V2_PALPW|nr:adenosine kinase [Paludibacter propionicigenes]ADQ78227.1 PfkB domain protein [Paludibacter propionicigenes WB4]
MKRILGMGNALTDILLQIDNDEVLSSLSLLKGGMQLINTERSEEINASVSRFEKKMATGGSASNTINGITRLGMAGGFVGKVGKDDIGLFFTNDSIYNGVEPKLSLSETPSGCCTVLVSPDGERTLCTYLGAACELEAADLTPELFAGYDIFHIEGYLVQNHDLIRTAVKLAKQEGLKVSIDMASYNVVEAHLDFLHEIVREYVDIVFANEEEARAYTGHEPEQALNIISEQCEIAIVKVGKEGSLIKSNNEKVRIKPRKANCIDTTGAGDLYASGFLFGLASNYSLEVCGKIGSVVSGNVVEVLGAKMSEEVWESIHEDIREIVLGR